MAGETNRSFLEMSDEDIAQMSFAPPQEAVVEESAVEDNGQVEASVAAVEEESTAAVEAATETGEETSDDSGSSGENATEASGQEAAQKAETPTETSVADPEKAAPAEEAIDYKAMYERLTAPFKANGRDIQVKNVDDAIALMQMGANYNKKMAALKPNLRLMKMLENNGLLSEEKLGYLIDLDKKNPEAIGKLIKESGLDPLDLDTKNASDYRPNHRAADEREVELDTVLDEIQDSPAYNRTLDVVSNRWDGPSKQIIAQSPQLLKVINSHIELGYYDLIAQEMENERLFGRLNGLSDIEAYRKVGDAIAARGGFAHLAPKSQGQQAPTEPVVVTPKPKMGDEDAKRKEKKLAASTSKPAVTAKPAEEFNPLALGDDEFENIIKKTYL